MLPDIQIKDNFLTEKELEIVNGNLNRINYTALGNEEGNFGFRHHFEKNAENEWFFEKIKKQFFPHVNLKPDNWSYHLRHNAKKVMSHNDGNDYNFLLYLQGKELVYNGTGFYTKKQLHSYIGFVQNRALFFDGKNNVHTDLQALGESSPRYTINIFYNYE
jgi:hypothetical protein|tara:strand:+ start:151 stop:633 length:483 start_codon:yes stop_codon:yes gene_type:complete